MATYLSTQCHDASASNLQSNFPEYLRTKCDVLLETCDFDQSESILIKHCIFLPVVRISLNLTTEQHRQCKHNVTPRRLHVTIFAVEEQ